MTGTTGLNQLSASTTNSWIDITASAVTAEYSWRSNFAAGALTVLSSTSYDPYKDYAIRVTYSSKFSQQPESSRTKVEDFILRLTPSSTCIWNALTKSAEIPNWTYTVSQSSVADSKSPAFTRTVSSCLIFQKLYFLDETVNTWVDYAASPANYPFVSSFSSGLNVADTNIGRLTILATRAMTASYYKPTKTYRVKITLDDQDANGLQLLEYQFTLTLADICS